jgi:hypothetical protein
MYENVGHVLQRPALIANEHKHEHTFWYRRNSSSERERKYALDKRATFYSVEEFLCFGRLTSLYTVIIEHTESLSSLLL